MLCTVCTLLPVCSTTQEEKGRSTCAGEGSSILGVRVAASGRCRLLPGCVGRHYAHTGGAVPHTHRRSAPNWIRAHIQHHPLRPWGTFLHTIARVSSCYLAAVFPCFSTQCSKPKKDNKSRTNSNRTIEVSSQGAVTYFTGSCLARLLHIS